MNKRKLSLTSQAIVTISVLLVAGITLMGVVLMNQSRTGMLDQINARMLDISNTAAAMLDGDALESLTADDAGTEPYEAALAALKVFQDNIELEYIYGIRKLDDGQYVFTIDPAENDPGAFGEPIVTTEALERAYEGTPAVDSEPYEDAWGSFYSAYSPVFNSKGEVAGVVAVDFSAKWVQDKVREQMLAILVAGVLALVVGAMVVLLLTSSFRQRLKHLNQAMRGLSEDVDALAREIRLPQSNGDPGRADDRRAGRSVDEIEALGEKIRATRRELHAYIDYAHTRAGAEDDAAGGDARQD